VKGWTFSKTKKMKTYKPTDENPELSYGDTTVFLAGSIEMGVAEDWQTRLTESLKDLDIVLFNPRRDSWDSSWVQRESNPQFNQQVNWEMNMLDRADFIFMYFSPDTKSPISLLELGLHADGRNMIVCCPDGFWRKGNVEIVCSRYNIPLYNDFDAAVASLISKIKKYQ
jgi:hypothetical protein